MTEFLIFVVVIAAVCAEPSTAEFHDPMINDGFFEGDIRGIDPDADRNAVPRDSLRWPGKTVPYVIDKSLSRYENPLLGSMRHIELNSCVRFVPRTTEKNYIKFVDGVGCSALWGFLGIGEQEITLGSGCLNFGTVVHEIMHALGFEHEHNRSDRDEYLIINWNNIPEKWYYAFRKMLPEENRLLTPFDYDSVMLYGQYTFSLGNGRKSMEATNGQFLKGVQNKRGLSKSDKERLNILYECKKN